MSEEKQTNGSMGLLRELFLVSMTLIRDKPEIADLEGGSAFIDLLDKAKKYLDASHGFHYVGEVKTRGVYFRLVGLEKDLDDCMKLLLPKEEKDALPIMEISLFVIPEGNHGSSENI